MTYKFYINEKRKNALMLRITNNRRKKELFMGVCWTPEALLDVMAQKPKPENAHKKAFLQSRISLLENLKMEIIGKPRVG